MRQLSAWQQHPSTVKVRRFTSSRRSARCQAGGPGGLPDRLLTSLTDVVNRVRDVPASLSLSTAPGQSRAFGFLAASSSALAVLALTIPDQLLEGVLPAPDYFGRFELLDSIYLRVAGTTLIPSAAVEYCLMDAAANDRLGSATYQRLMLGCAAKSAGFLAAFAQASEVWTPQLAALYPTMAALSLAINLKVFSEANTQLARQGKAAPSLGLGQLLPQNSAAWVYSAITLVFCGLAAACYASTSLFLGTESATALLLKHTWAPGLLLTAVASLNLRDAADRGRLGASTFKRLNLGIAGLGAVYSVVFAACLATKVTEVDSLSVINLALALGVLSYCLYQWLYATK